MAELTGPDNCAECGTHLSAETALAGDAGPLVVAFDGGMTEIPGLYVCTECAGAVMVGEKPSTVTLEQAVKFLTEIYIPLLADYMTTAQNELAAAYNRFMD